MNPVSQFGEYERGIELVELNGDTGIFLVDPYLSEVEVGDVFFIREKPSNESQEKNENGLIVQVIEFSSAKFPSAYEKVLFRLMEKSKAERIHEEINEEPMDEIERFKQAKIKVRAMIKNSKWQQWDGYVTTKNVDIFKVYPDVLFEHTIRKHDKQTANFYIGDVHNKPLKLGGKYLGKITLITGNKGTGKSHIMKGLVDFYRRNGINVIVFDFNNEYTTLPDAFEVRPMENFKFRLDELPVNAFIELVKHLVPFSPNSASEQAFEANIADIIEKRKQARHVPDLEYLMNDSTLKDFRSGEERYDRSVRDTIKQRLKDLSNYNLIMTELEARNEDQIMNFRQQSVPQVFSQKYLLYLLKTTNKPIIISFEPFARKPRAREVVVEAILESIVKFCRQEKRKHESEQNYVPNYPVIVFEEAHMYLPQEKISELLSIVRHIGVDVFFVTNTPSALPETLFRLMDNLIMYQLLNERDIQILVKSGLPIDRETIEAFAKSLKEYHALIISAKNGVTSGFPVICKVRDFVRELGLSPSGVTHSPWDGRV